MWLLRGQKCTGERDWEFGISRGKLLAIGWINKILLYTTGNYIQYPVTNYNAKEYGKVYIYVCMYVFNLITLMHSRN